MKKFFSIISITLCLILAFTSCSSDENLEDKTTDSFVELDLNFYEKSSMDSHLIEEFAFIGDKKSSEPVFKILYDTKSESLNKILFSEKFMSENDISKNAIEAELNKFHTKSKLDPTEPELSPHASCIEWCKQNYTDEEGNKIKGRGACKGNCWVDTIKEVVKEIVPF